MSQSETSCDGDSTWDASPWAPHKACPGISPPKRASLTTPYKEATPLQSPSPLLLILRDSSLLDTTLYLTYHCQSPPLGQKLQERRGMIFVALIVTVYHVFSVPEEPGREKALDG